MPGQRRIFTVLSLATLTVAVGSFIFSSAPPGGPLDPGSDIFELHSFGAGASTPYLDLVAGHITAGLVVDLAFLRDGIPVLLSEPGNLYAPLTFPVTDATAICVLPGLGQNGLDELLIATSSGARAIGRDYTVSPSTFTTPRNVGRTIAWMNARKIRTGFVGADSDVDLYGIHHAGLIILYLPDVEFASSGDEVFFVLSSPAIDIHAFRRRASDPELSFAILTEAGLQIADAGGNLDPLLPANSTAGAIAVLPDPAQGFDLVAWIHRDSNTDEELIQVYSDQVLSSPVSLGDLKVVAAASGDFDDDGDADLLVSHKSDYVLNYYENEGGTFSGTATPYLTASQGSAAPDNQANPVFLDLDGDNDLDFAFAIAADETMLTHENPLNDARASGPVLKVGLDETRYVVERWGDDTWVTLHLEIDLTAAPLPPGVTHVELSTWRRPDIATPTTSLAYEWKLFDITGPPYPTEIDYDLELERDQSPIPTADLDSAYFLQLRYVVATGEAGSETITKVYPSHRYSYTSDHIPEPGNVLDWIQSFPDHESELHVLSLEYWIDGTRVLPGGGGGGLTDDGPKPPPANDDDDGDDETHH